MTASIHQQLQDGETITRSGNDIVVELTAEGIIIASDDTEALDRFESLLRQLIPPGTTLTDRQITVFYLKYVKSDVAKTLVQQIMSGGEDSSSGLGSLVSDATSSLMGGGLMGMISEAVVTVLLATAVPFGFRYREHCFRSL